MSRKIEDFMAKVIQKNPGEVDNMALVGIISYQIIHDQFVKNFPVKSVRPAEPAIFIDKRSGLSA